MEGWLDPPLGSLLRPMDGYNADAPKGIESKFFEFKDWPKRLDAGPRAAFKISFDKTSYHFVAWRDEDHRALRSRRCGWQDRPGLLCRGRGGAPVDIGQGYCSALSRPPS